MFLGVFFKYFLVVLGSSLWFLVVPGGTWCCLVVQKGSCWFLVVLEGSWCVCLPLYLFFVVPGVFGAP